MAYMTLNGWTLPVRNGSAQVEHHEVGHRGMAFDGTPFAEVRFDGRLFQVESTQLLAIDAQALRGLVAGQGHRWDFEDSGASNRWKYANSGAGSNATITSAARSTANAKFGSAQLRVSASGSVVWPLGLGSNWTAMMHRDSGSGYAHFCRTSSGLYVDGTTVSQVGSFDGTDDIVDYGDVTALDGASSATFSGWIYIPATDSGCMLERFAGSGGVRFEVVSGQNLSLWLYNGASNWEQTNGSPLTVAGWHHVAAVYESSAITLYVNGAVATSITNGTIPSTIPTPSSSTTLKHNAGDLAARMSNFAFWAGHAATAAQITEIYDAGRNKKDYKTFSLPDPDFWVPANGTWEDKGGGATPSLSGFASDSASFTSEDGEQWALVDDGSFTLQNPTSGDVDFDDVVVYPFDISSGQAAAFAARTSAFPNPPELELGGDLIRGETASVRASELPVGAQRQFRDADTSEWVNNGEIVRLRLVEVP